MEDEIVIFSIDPATHPPKIVQQLMVGLAIPNEMHLWLGKWIRRVTLSVLGNIPLPGLGETQSLPLGKTYQTLELAS